MSLVGLFTEIADAIRSKNGTTEKINATDFPTQIANIVTASPLKLTSGAYLFSNNARSDNESEIIEYLDSITDATSMYEGNTTLTTLDLSRIDFSNCKSITKMCSGCTKVTSINLKGCDFSNVTSGTYAFNNMDALTTIDLSNLNFSKISDFTGFFGSSSGLASVNLTNCNLSGAKNLYDMFAGTSVVNVDFSTCELNNVTSLYQTFNCTYSIKTVNFTNCNLSKVTNARNMFYLSSIQRVVADSIDFTRCTDFSNAFYNCNQLTDLPEINGPAINNLDGAFSWCSKLVNFPGIKNLGKGYTQKTTNYAKYKLDMTRCTSLSHSSLVSIINNLYNLNLTYDVANGGTLYTQQLIIGADNIAKLTEEELAVATNKRLDSFVINLFLGGEINGRYNEFK